MPISIPDLMQLLPLGRKASYLVGVDIGCAAIKVVGVHLGAVPSVHFATVVPLPKEYGERTIVDILQRIVKEHDLAGKEAALIFADDSTAIRRLELPQMAPTEIANALKWQARDMVTFDVETALIDFTILGELQHDDGSRVLDVLCVVMSKDVVDQRVRMVKDAGLTVVAVNVASFALGALMALMHGPEEKETVVMIDMGCSATEIMIFRNNILEFVRMVRIGSNDLSIAMVGTVMCEKGRVDISIPDAEEMKVCYGIPYNEEVVTDKGITSLQMVSLMRPVIERLSKEIRLSIDYYMHQYGGDSPVRGYLTGGGSLLKHFDQYLSEELAVPVQHLVLPAAVSVSKTHIEPATVSSVLGAIGAALGYKRKVNLLPHEYRVEKVEFLQKVSLRLVAIIMGCVLAVSYLFVKVRIDDYSYRLRSYQNQRIILAQVKELYDRVAERTVLLTEAQKGEVPAEYIMKELSTVIPANVVLTALTINQRERTMVLQGYVDNPQGPVEEILTHFMEELQRSKYFKDAQLGSVQGEGATAAVPNTKYNFEITCLIE